MPIPSEFNHFPKCSRCYKLKAGNLAPIYMFFLKAEHICSCADAEFTVNDLTDTIEEHVKEYGLYKIAEALNPKK